MRDIAGIIFTDGETVTETTLLVSDGASVPRVFDTFDPGDDPPGDALARFGQMFEDTRTTETDDDMIAATLDMLNPRAPTSARDMADYTLSISAPGEAGLFVYDTRIKRWRCFDGYHVVNEARQ